MNKIWGVTVIDMHSHILPGIDDGPQTIEKSLNMAEDAWSQGIKKVVASPHHMNGQFQNTREKIIEHVKVFSELLEAHQIPLEIYPGQEVRIYDELLEDLDNNKLMTVNDSRYLLLELPYDYVPRRTLRIIDDLLVKGIVPIIVHPERNKEIRDDFDIIFEMVLMGALTQVTTGSLLGMFGKEVEKFSWQLIDGNLAHMIATDSHDDRIRYFDLREAYELIERKKNARIVAYFKDNSMKVLEDIPIQSKTPRKVTEKKLLKRFFK